METEPHSIGQLIVTICFFGGLAAYPILQFLAWRRMRGGWRTLACVPLVVMIVVLAITAIGIYQGAALSLAFLILVLPFVLAYLVALMVSHTRVMRRKP